MCFLGSARPALTRAIFPALVSTAWVTSALTCWRRLRRKTFRSGEFPKRRSWARSPAISTFTIKTSILCLAPIASTGRPPRRKSRARFRFPHQELRRRIVRRSHGAQSPGEFARVCRRVPPVVLLGVGGSDCAERCNGARCSVITGTLGGTHFGETRSAGEGWKDCGGAHAAAAGSAQGEDGAGADYFRSHGFDFDPRTYFRRNKRGLGISWGVVSSGQAGTEDCRRQRQHHRRRNDRWRLRNEPVRRRRRAHAAHGRDRQRRAESLTYSTPTPPRNSVCKPRATRRAGWRELRALGREIISCSRARGRRKN